MVLEESTFELTLDGYGKMSYKMKRKGISEENEG